MKEMLLDKLFNERKIELKITWRLVFWIVYTLTSSFFVLRAFENTYVNWLSGLLWVVYFFNILFTLLLIRKEE